MAGSVALDAGLSGSRQEGEGQRSGYPSHMEPAQGTGRRGLVAARGSAEGRISPLPHGPAPACPGVSNSKTTRTPRARPYSTRAWPSGATGGGVGREAWLRRCPVPAHRELGRRVSLAAREGRHPKVGQRRDLQQQGQQQGQQQQQ